MELIQSLNWQIEQYIRKVEELEAEASVMGVGVSYVTGQIIVYKKVIRDL